MKIAVFNTKFYEKENIEAFNVEPKHHLVFYEVPLNMDTKDLCTGFDAVCLANEIIDEKMMVQLSMNGIKLIDLRSTGYDNVNLLSARNCKIRVTRVPSYSPSSIAEYATAMILTLNRKTHKVYNRVRDNIFTLDGLMGFTLSGKTVGVVGTGDIGTAFCKIMLGFGCEVIAFDPQKSVILEKLGVRYLEFDEFLSKSDIISIHCPFTEQTHHMFNGLTFGKMKKGAMLINTSRGRVVKTSDAIEALKTKQLGFFGLDVYEQEREVFNKDFSEGIVLDDQLERLIAFSNVLLSPHQGYFTKEAVDQIALVTIKNFTDFEKGLPLVNEVKAI
jgi:D-lactate dehydrogenase